MPLPPVSDVSVCAREIVLAAKKKNALSSLTKRLVRQQVESQLGLEEGSLSKEKNYKDAVSDAISNAISAAPVGSGSEGTEEEDGGETKKRKLQRKSGERKIKGEHSPGTKHNIKKTPIPYHEDQGDLRPTKLSKVEPVPPSSPTEYTGDADAEPTDAALEIKSESELSVLIDEPPKKKRAKKSKEAAAKEKNKRSNENSSKRASGPAGEDKNEATIKRLKAFVTACGVRKVWSKEFCDMSKPSQQIAHLKKILGDLGMTGRFSMEQSKAIREKRELASELADVQSFEKAIVGRSSKRKSKIPPTQNKDTTPDQVLESESGSQSESDGNEMPVKRRPKNALASIQAFLGDESE